MASASSSRLSWAAVVVVSLLGLCLATAWDLAAALEQPVVGTCGPDSDAESCGAADVSSALQLRRETAESGDEDTQGGIKFKGITEWILKHFVQQYAAIAETRLTATPSDEATSKWITKTLEGAGLNVELQKYHIPGAQLWVPDGDGSTASHYGCLLKLDRVRVPCYVVQSPPAKPVDISNVPMKRVLVIQKMHGYELGSAQELLLQHVDASGKLPYDVAIVVNLGYTPNPFTWKQEGIEPAMIPVIEVPNMFASNVRWSRKITKLRLSGTWKSDAKSQNVIATLKSYAPAACSTKLARPLPFYLGTPVNCFFDCGPHRAAGVAVLMAVAHDLASKPVRCHKGHFAENRCMMPVFGFSSGHDMGDPGITAGILPWLQNLTSGLNVPMSEVVYVNIGANLGNRAEKNGQPAVLPLLVESFQQKGSDTSAAMSAFQVNVCSGSNSVCSQPPLSAVEGAGRTPVQAGLMVVNLASFFGEPFESPPVHEIQFEDLRYIAKGVSKAVRAAICSGR
ncbi:unnamed protein product [Polarella glacialis]|uniref:Subtilisin n=1 Tax=Polarella glacialis TaxID=89957 RepID=A0A813LNE5_POLGL|nr:unnamed protein product [Polarella glacialis]CAE8734274.1 unnamed protein product [Polarella glacialis]|mmetsp:Transcript_84017/g.151649  ORF Transcript_84017/g.151649 Transcript_84017/m.151649 type:complete len:510 (-) Transcript_84017:143-1672(-)